MEVERSWAGWLTRKLDRLGNLDAEDRARLATLPMIPEQTPRGRRIVREGDEPDRCCLLLDGFASRFKHTADGSRQIVSFHVRGDLLDIQHLLLSRADHSVETLTTAKIAWIPKADIIRLAWERPSIGKALWQDSLIDASVFREWVLNVGQRDATARIAHMLCEFAVRSQAAGLGSVQNLSLPLTQVQIADATGLTSVHVNRRLKVLRESGALSKTVGGVQIGSWEKLRAIAHFDPAYLHAAA
jgi:CRP-like cAMP-binding protein